MTKREIDRIVEKTQKDFEEYCDWACENKEFDCADDMIDDANTENIRIAARNTALAIKRMLEEDIQKWNRYGRDTKMAVYSLHEVIVRIEQQFLEEGD